jgi:hypothetical protein
MPASRAVIHSYEIVIHNAMLCELLTNSIGNYPDFNPTLLPVIRAQIATWKLHPKAERPDYHCLSEVWEMGERQVGKGIATAENVAEALEVIIVEGDVDPFVDVGPSMVDSHVLTSHSATSLALCRRLRGNAAVVGGSGYGAGNSPFIRAVALGFRWDDRFDGRVPGFGTLQQGADPTKVQPSDLLAAYRLASAMSADRVGASIESGSEGSAAALRHVADGIVRCLRERYPSGGVGGAESVIRIIELERVIEGMVELLVGQPASQAQALVLRGDGSGAQDRQALIGRDWFGLDGTDGPLSHLRSYAALGQPLMALVGRLGDAEVRRDIERIMERITPEVLPGFPSIAATSRRPSDLLRRLRYLVRSMALRAAEPNAPQIFRDFRRDLFHGADANVELAAARIAFTRPRHGAGASGASLQVRADLQNLVEASGMADAGAGDLATHACVAALRRAVLIDIETWSNANDADTTDIPDAVHHILREIEGARGMAPNALVREVFNVAVCARALEAVQAGQGPERYKLFVKFDRLHKPDDRSHAISRAIREGLPAFRRLIEDNYHREFDRKRLAQDVAGQTVFRVVDEMDKGDNGSRCKAWLTAWAFVNDSGVYVSASEALPAQSTGDLVSLARAEPYSRSGVSGGSFVFDFADAAAAGGEAPKQVLAQLASGTDARLVFQSAAHDAVGRSVALAIAQVCSRELLDVLFGARAGFALPFAASVDGVTPTMAAVRHAANENAASKQGLDAVLRRDNPSGGADNRRDRRGWRAIHHAFAVGHLDAAKRLVAADPSCIAVQKGDKTTFLIEAFRCRADGVDASAVTDYALDLLSGLSEQDRRAVFAFRGPIDMNGHALSLVGAALSTADKGNWTKFIGLASLYQHAADRDAIWAGLDVVTFQELLSHDDFLLFGEYCDHVVAANGADQLRKFVSGVSGKPATNTIVHKVKTSRAALAARAKLQELRKHGALEAASTSPFDGGNMFHELVDAASEAVGAREEKYEADIHALAVQVLSGLSPSAAQAAVEALDHDHESPIWKASRKGCPALALAYARFLGSPSGTGDARWMQAARFVKDLGRFQDGIPAEYRVQLGADRLLRLGTGNGQSVLLTPNALAAELNTRAACAWLQRNATAIAQSLKIHFRTEVDVGSYSFINWLSHLASDVAQGAAAGHG